MILQSLVGSIIEWRRPGHAIGRLMMLAGPLYAFASAGWTTVDLLQTPDRPGGLPGVQLGSAPALVVSHGAHHRLDPPPLPDRQICRVPDGACPPRSS